ncbi:MAG TPA: SRPBCC family protein [Chitinophagales bacterium]|nr:SRPBCC family protein [Chitinophagales bacterium]
MHYIKQQQFLPITLAEAWSFFATPTNLNKITPPEMKFKVLSEIPEQMYEGLIIRYEIMPMLNIPMQWVTEITHIKPLQFFVDEQRQGPYNIWHHEHHFAEMEGGVMMTDILHYDIGKSIFGWLAGQLFVHRAVRQIFDHRKVVLDELFKK